MPTLQWIGKDKVVNHHRDVPFRVLEHQYGFSREGGQSSNPCYSGNKIIHGDNLEALKALLPEYEGRVKCIYIDPPYNTGNENWVYNDNVSDPKIRKWLGEVVGKESDDLTRHDKWLCMMYPRLKLLHKLLHEEGVIFISIDDNEVASLTLLLNEIFGTSNFIGKTCWFKKRKGSYLSKEFVSLTEYILIYRKAGKLLLHGGIPNSDESQPLVKRTNAPGILKFPAKSVTTKLKSGVYKAGKYGRGSSAIELLDDAIVDEGTFISQVILKGPFTWSQSFLDEELKKESQLTINTRNFQPRAFRNSGDKSKGFPSFIDGREMHATTDDAYEELRKIFSVDRVFEYSKPYQLVQYLIKAATWMDKNAVILDSFAGSGTTAHAVMKMNMEDEGRRTFVLVEMEAYANDITAKRVKQVINGYADQEAIEDTFDYYQLAEPLFSGNNSELLNESVAVEKIRSYIWYTETRASLPQTSATEKYLLGLKNGSAYYFLFEKDRPITLDIAFLSTMETTALQYIIYADNCLLAKDFMLRHNIIFKKIPRDIARF